MSWKVFLRVVILLGAIGVLTGCGGPLDLLSSDSESDGGSTGGVPGGGGTGTAPAVVRALEEWDTLDIILLTDGHPNCGAPGTEGHTQMILDANLQGAAIHTYGIGSDGISETWLAELSAITGGVHIHIFP